jgi:hypothetical protein
MAAASETIEGHGGDGNVKDWRDNNEVDLPEWVAILDPKRKPIDTKALNKEELVAEFERRFVALLQKSDSINSLEGWRDVAVDLAFEFHPAFKIKEQKAIPVSGRPISSFQWIIKNAFLSRKRKLERIAEREAAGTRWEGKPTQKGAQAAREISKEWADAQRVARSATRHLSANASDGIERTPTAKRIQNIAAERIPFPAEWSAEDYLFNAKSAARTAARRITEV